MLKNTRKIQYYPIIQSKLSIYIGIIGGGNRTFDLGKCIRLAQLV